MPSETNSPTIALIGFGEAAQAFAKGWAPDHTGPIRIFDIKSNDDASRQPLQKTCAHAQVACCDTIKDCLSDADVIFSLVTADQALVAAQSTQRTYPENALYFDCNSCAPDAKRAAANIIEAAGGRYVDTAVMSPVHPALHKTPLLISGPHSIPALAMLAHLDMNATETPGDIGAASTIKMLRSVMVKGLEALIAECLLSARHAGVEDTIIASLEKSYPGFGWADRAGYALERMCIHGPRRAAEMREVAKTISALGLPDPMSRATADWQQAIGDLSLSPDTTSYKSLADQILSALPETAQSKD